MKFTVQTHTHTHHRIRVSTVAILSVSQEGWDDDEAPLSHAHAQQTLLHALYEVALSHVGVIGHIPGIAAPKHNADRLKAEKQIEVLRYSYDTGY